MFNPIKLLLADDHEVVVQGLVSVLNGRPEVEVVAQAANGEQVLELLKHHPIDVVLLDIEMPILSGLETLKILRSDYPHIKVIAFTIYSGRDLFAMLDAGVDGYLLKSSSMQELIKAIVRVYDGESYFSPELNKQMGDYEFAKKNGKYIENGFTPREIEIIKLIADGYSSIEIAETLFISKATADTHRKNILAKLGINKISGIVRYAIENKLV